MILRSWWLVAFLITSVLCCLTFAEAWEFKMKGEYEWRFRYLGRLGDKDLFGQMQLQDRGGPLIGLAGPNIYGRGFGSNTPFFRAANVRIVRTGLSQTDPDAHYLEQRVTLFPEISVNKAIQFRSVFTIGGYRNKFDRTVTGVGLPPFERSYMEHTSVNGYDTAGIISMEQWTTLINLPWGTISVGIKSAPIGVGATLARNTRGSALALVIPYGPLKIVPGIWAGRSRFSDGWNTAPDRAEKRSFYGSMGIIYAAGPTEMGIMAVGSKYNANAWESTLPMLYQNLNAPFDEWVSIGILYEKYFNGRFFLNAEFAALNQDIRPVGTLPLYVEARHFFIESGIVAGPAKLSLIAAHTTGPAFNQPNPTKLRLPFAINYQTLEPYEWLMFNTYAGGNNGGWSGATVPLTNDEQGQLADGYAFAARLDYAIAANLNVWGSYMWAHATEHAAGFAGGVASDGGVGNTTAAQAQNWKALNTGFPAAGLNPYVDDGFLGWEVNAGIDWKLLENIALHLRWACWQPGEWFDQAYQAVTVRGGAVVTDGLLIGRDPINALEFKMRIDF